jgi:outer membrane protein TolC
MAQGNGLKMLIDHAQKHNGQIRAKEITVTAKSKEIEAAESAYWPTVDIGGHYARYSPSYVIAPGEETTGFAKMNFELYDGGRKEATLQAKTYEKEASLFEKEAFKKSVTLQIVQHYYGIKGMEASLHALEERAKELKAQIVRVRKFLATGLTTQEEVDKLLAVYENNRYSMENTRLAITTHKENLRLITGIKQMQLGRNYFLEPKRVKFEWFDPIKQLEARLNAVGESAHAIEAANMPQVSLSDTYFQSNFSDSPSMPALPGIGGDGFLVDHQNELKLSVNMRLFDHGRVSKESEAVRYQKLSLMSELEHAKRQQQMNYRLAKETLKTTRAKIQSAKSALKAAESTYVTIRKKFEAGLVDDIAYLDALAQKTLAQARYKETVYDYEVKKSVYYYYAGKDPKEFIR